MVLESLSGKEGKETPFAGIIELRSANCSKDSKRRTFRMGLNDINSLSHTKWNCKYHVVFAVVSRITHFCFKTPLPFASVNFSYLFARFLLLFKSQKSGSNRSLFFTFLIGVFNDRINVAIFKHSRIFSVKCQQN